MTDLGTVFADLGRRLGMGDLWPDSSGPLVIGVDGVGTLTFELDRDSGDLLASLSWPLAPYDRTTLPAALRACALEKSPEWPFQAGLFGDRALIMIRRRPDDLSAPAVEELILRLAGFRETLP